MSIIRTHHFGGTAGTTIDVQAQDFNSKDGTEGTFIAGAYIKTGSSFVRHTPYAYVAGSWQKFDVQ